MLYTPSPPVEIIHNNQHPTRVVVVGGCGRGGTTALRDLVANLGVDMMEGIRADPGNWQTGLLGDLPAQRVVIAKHMAEDKLWGWKDIFLLSYLPQVLDLLPGLRLLFIFRGPFTTAMRAHIQAPSRKLLPIMEEILEYQKQIIHFTQEHPELPIAFVSYEKLCAYPTLAVEQVAGFLKLQPTTAAASVIQCGQGYAPNEKEINP